MSVQVYFVHKRRNNSTKVPVSSADICLIAEESRVITYSERLISLALDHWHRKQSSNYKSNIFLFKE